MIVASIIFKDFHYIISISSHIFLCSRDLGKKMKLKKERMGCSEPEVFLELVQSYLIDEPAKPVLCGMALVIIDNPFNHFKDLVI